MGLHVQSQAISRRVRIPPSVFSSAAPRACYEKLIAVANDIYFKNVAHDTIGYDHNHGRRKRGLCRGSDTPNYLCGGDIDMYIPLEKPNT